MRPWEAPDIWCPENHPKSPSYSQNFGPQPQIVKFGQRWPCDVPNGNIISNIHLHNEKPLTFVHWVALR